MRSAYMIVVIVVVTGICYLMILGAFVRNLIFGSDDGRLGHRIAGIWGRTIFRLIPGWKITIKGEQNLPKADQPTVMVANHESMADIAAMYFLKVQFRWLSKEEVFRYPVIGHAMRIAGYVPVRRGDRNSHAQAMDESANRIRLGLSMFFFPEGTRSETGELRPFKVGAFKLARDTGVPILPIALHGAGQLLRKGTLIPHRAEVKVAILPMVTDDGTLELEEFAAKVRGIIAEEHRRLF